MRRPAETSFQRPQACGAAERPVVRPETLAERREFYDRDAGARFDADAVALVKELVRGVYVPLLEPLLKHHGHG